MHGGGVDSPNGRMWQRQRRYILGTTSHTCRPTSDFMIFVLQKLVRHKHLWPRNMALMRFVTTITGSLAAEF